MSTMHACARRGAAVEAITHQGRLEVAPQAKLLLASLPSPPPSPFSPLLGFAGPSALPIAGASAPGAVYPPAMGRFE
jgi:hypothetical protein